MSKGETTPLRISTPSTPTTPRTGLSLQRLPKSPTSTHTPRHNAHKIVQSPIKSLNSSRGHTAGITIMALTSSPSTTNSPWPPQTSESARLPKILTDNRKGVTTSVPTTPRQQNEPHKLTRILGFKANTPAHPGALRRRNRSEKTALDVVKGLSSESMSGLLSEFNKAEQDAGRLGIHEFIRVMKKFVPYAGHQDETIDLLCELFADIDTDEDERITWNDMVNYFVEIGIQVQDVVEGAGVKRGWVRTGETDESQQSGHIEKVYYFPGMRCIFSLETTNTIRLYDAEDLSLVHTLSGGSENIPYLAADYIADYGLLAATSTQNLITFWELSSFQQRRRIRLNDTHSSLRWDSKSRLLFSGSVRGLVHGWNIETLRDDIILQGHTNVVTDMLAPPELGFLVTASLDTTVKVWDPAMRAEKTNLMGHTKGVTSLAFSKTHNLLLSSGFEQDVFVWNPFINKCVAKMKGHQSSVVSIQCVPDAPHVVTGDREGYIKVWDIRNFGLLHSFQVAGAKEITSICIPASKSIVCSGPTKLCLYRFKEKGESNKEEAEAMTIILFNTSTSQFVAAAGCHIRIWDANSGKLVRSYRNLFPFEISALCFDGKERRIFVADTKGSIKCFHFNNGEFIKDFSAHEAEIQHLIYSQEIKSLISVSAERQTMIKVHSDPEENRISIVRCLHGHEGAISAVAYSPLYCLLAAVSNKRKVLVWDLQKGSLEGSFTSDSELTSLEYVKQSPMLICGDAKGFVSLYTTFPASMKSTPVMKFSRFGCDPAPITKLHFHESTMRLYTVDELSNIRIWRLPFMDLGKPAPPYQRDYLSKNTPSAYLPPPEILQEIEQSAQTKRWQELFQKLQTMGSDSLLKMTTLVSEWGATEESIVSTTYLTDPASLVCLYFDGYARIYNPDGKQLGIFPPPPRERVPWFLEVGRSRHLEFQEKSEKYAKSVRKSIEETVPKIEAPAAPLKTPFLAMTLSTRLRQGSQSFFRRKSSVFMLACEDIEETSSDSDD